MKTLELFETAAIDVSDEDERMDAVIQALINAGETVKRYDSIGMKKDFKENEMIENLLDTEGPDLLPIALIDGVVVKQGAYPQNTEIIKWFSITEEDIASCCKSTGKGCGGCKSCGGHHEA